MEGWIMSTVLAFPQPNVKPRNSAALKAEDNIKKNTMCLFWSLSGLKVTPKKPKRKLNADCRNVKWRLQLDF